MSKIINYDFNIDSLISVKAPAGTDPVDLIGDVMEKLKERLSTNSTTDIEVSFDQCYDSETGAYSEDWKNLS